MRVLRRNCEFKQVTRAETQFKNKYPSKTRQEQAKVIQYVQVSFYINTLLVSSQNSNGSELYDTHHVSADREASQPPAFSPFRYRTPTPSRTEPQFL